MTAGETRQETAPPKAPTTRKTDGQDGPALTRDQVLAQTQTIAQAIPGKNAAMTEAKTATDGWVNPAHPARAKDVVIVDAMHGIVTSTRRKIAICGFASSSREQIPVHDPSWEIWGLNQLYRHIVRADRWFDIHRHWHQDVVPGTEGVGPGSYIGWLRECGMPFYMADPEPSIPTAVRYPLERVIAHHETDYFTSTIAFMVALAVTEIDERVEAELESHLKKMRRKDITASAVRALQQRIYATYTIGVFGVDLIVGGEYFHEKPCAEHWLGIASGRGIQIALPAETALCKQRFRYGYEREPQTIIKLSEIADMQAQIEKERLECVKRFDFLNGAFEANSRWSQLIELRLRGLGT